MQKAFVACMAGVFLLLAAVRPAVGGDDMEQQRLEMVEQQILARGIKDMRVLAAMRKVPRHLFVPNRYRSQAYEDHPLPIGLGQTISQPYIVAFMAAAVDLQPDETVLEIGTGSGYAAAVLAELGQDVYTIEILAPLAEKARLLLAELGYDRVHVKSGDGYLGWPEKAPFNAIVVSCAPENVPETLVEQLADGGRIIIPVGEAGGVQKLVRGVKRGDLLEIREVMPVRFVPMVHAPGSDGE